MTVNHTTYVTEVQLGDSSAQLGIQDRTNQTIVLR